MKKAERCAIHTDTKLVCPKCMATKGGAATAAKHGNKQMQDWGKLGGRPKKKITTQAHKNS